MQIMAGTPQMKLFTALLIDSMIDIITYTPILLKAANFFYCIIE